MSESQIDHRLPPSAQDFVAGPQTDLIFKALASKPRREILALLAAGAGEGDERCCSPDEVCACVFSERLGLGAPTVSHHMKALGEAQLVTAEKRGAWVHYRLRTDAIRQVVAGLTALLEGAARTCGPGCLPK